MYKRIVCSSLACLLLFISSSAWADRNDIVHFAGPSYPSGFGGVNSTVYAWNGAALSNNVSTFRFDFQTGKTLRFARLLCVWTPNSAQAGIKLLHMDDGPSNLTDLAECPHAGQITPIVSAVDITSALNALIANGVKKHLGWQSKSNGVTPPTIYKISLELVYQD